MRRRFRIALWVGGGLLAGILLAVLALYLAARHVPAAYRRALAADPEAEAQASDAMIRQTTELANAVRRSGPWSARFTAEQINGWFAVDMNENHPDLLPPEMSDPRVAIAPEEMRLFCRFRRGGVESVLSLGIDVYLAEADVIALRVRRARAGALPLPLDEVLQQITQQARRKRLRIQWKMAEGDPVALIRLDLRDKESGHQVHVQALELREGEVFVSGESQ